MTTHSFKTRLKRLVRIVRQIIRDRDYSLLAHLDFIDADFYTRELAQDLSWRDPHPLFDSEYYQARYLHKSYSGHPFRHYLKKGYVAGHLPGPYFDPTSYAENTGWQPEDGNPLLHYLRKGVQENPDTGPFFQGDWYRDRNPSLAEAAVDLLSHYRIHGAREGKSPAPVFDPQFYLKTIDQEQESITDPLAHYLTYGAPDDHQPSACFDPVFYRERYSQELRELLPLEHYLKYGIQRGYYPNRKVAGLPVKPIISILVPVYNAEPAFLNNCIRSVLYQSYPHWQLCLANDGSSRPATAEQLANWQGIDPRIRITSHATNRGISAATNSAAELAEGDYLGFLDNDDELVPACLETVVGEICATGAQALYSDEDLIGDDGRRFSIFRKPQFNQPLLLSHNYITHFAVLSRSLYRQLGGVRSTCDGAQDFDLMLRMAASTSHIAHIPEILYHWRAAQTSTSINHGQKGYAHQAGKMAIKEYLATSGIAAEVWDGEISFYYRSRPQLTEFPRVTVFLWAGEGYDSATVDNLTDNTSYPHCEFVLLDGAGRTQQNTDISKYKTVHEAVAESGPELVCFLDASLCPADDHWLLEMVSTLAFKENGLVSGRIGYPDGDGPSYRLPDLDNTSADYLHDFLCLHTLHMNGLHCPQYTQLVNGDCFLISYQLYMELGGFDHERFPELFAAADLALRAGTMGWRTQYTPYARFTRKESVYEKGETAAKEERNAFMATYKNRFPDLVDPYYNRGLLADNSIGIDQFKSWLTDSS